MSKPEKYLLVGAGIQSQAIAYDLCRNPALSQLTVVDFNGANLAELDGQLRDPRLVLVTADCRDRAAMADIIAGHDAVVSASSYDLNYDLTRLAIAAGAHFCDLGGNNAVVERQFALDAEAKKRGVKVVPDCGVAPGAVSIITRYGIDRMGGVPDSVRIRVGGLPAEPTGLLKYALVFSVHGLFNECLEPVEVLLDGRIAHMPSLAGLEVQRFKGLGDLEAAYTSGGSSTLAKTYAGKIKNLDYKTLRYPGHWAVWQTLRELGYLSEEPILADGAAVRPRYLSEALFEKMLPRGVEDILVLRVILEKDGKRRRYDLIDRFDLGTGHSAMQRTTGYSAAIIAQMMVKGAIKDDGVLCQELSVPATLFVEEWKKRGLIIKEVRR